MDFSFNRKLRLLAPIQFSYVFKKPMFQTKTSKINILCRTNILNHPRLGISIARNTVRKSHERNRIKRLIRETFRLVQHKLVHLDYVLIVHKETSLLYNNINLIKLLEDLWNRYYC